MQLVEHIREVHKTGSVYGDLKPENVLLMSNGSIRLTSFGKHLLRDRREKRGRLQVSLEYLSPEVINQVVRGDSDSQVIEYD